MPDKFSLADTSGNPHDYTVQPHPAGEGTRLVLTLMGLAGEPLGRLLESELGGVAEKIKSGEVSLDDDVSELAKGIDFSAIARDLRMALAAVDGPQLFCDILKYTHRDGHPLAESGHYDAAYQQNYGELLKAVWRVVQVNGFLGFIGSLTNG